MFYQDGINSISGSSAVPYLLRYGFWIRGWPTVSGESLAPPQVPKVQGPEQWCKTSSVNTIPSTARPQGRSLRAPLGNEELAL